MSDSIEIIEVFVKIFSKLLELISTDSISNKYITM